MVKEEDAATMGEAIDTEPIGEKSRVSATITLAFNWIVANFAVVALRFAKNFPDIFCPDFGILEKDRNARPEDVLRPPVSGAILE